MGETQDMMTIRSGGGSATDPLTGDVDAHNFTSHTIDDLMMYVLYV